jgi:hypothetical protein
MKIIQLLALCFFSSFSFSQSNTEIFLFDLENNNSKIELKNGKNISNSDGYDNQPSFYSDNLLLFVSTRNSQTDIVTYNILNKEVDFINSTPEGGEYSPQKIPNSNNVSAVRLDNDGKQRLYTYDFKTGSSEVLIDSLVVAYYTWYDEQTIVSAVIEADNLKLYVTNTKTGQSRTYDSNIGRSFHKIPNSNLVSFISKEYEKWHVKSLNPLTGEMKVITETAKNSEDMCWLIDGSIIMPMKNTIYKFNPKMDEAFTVFKAFNDDNLQNITRIATNEKGTLLALVSEVQQ